MILVKYIVIIGFTEESKKLYEQALERNQKQYSNFNTNISSSYSIDDSNKIISVNESNDMLNLINQYSTKKIDKFSESKSNLNNCKLPLNYDNLIKEEVKTRDSMISNFATISDLRGKEIMFSDNKNSNYKEVNKKKRNNKLKNNDCTNYIQTKIFFNNK